MDAAWFHPRKQGKEEDGVFAGGGKPKEIADA